ncbi:hypothetical protein P8452_26885 [Trifolium repens]|nr:hypothetical protein P8452_26885 [Trifolium repens]
MILYEKLKLRKYGLRFGVDFAGSELKSERLHKDQGVPNHRLKLKTIRRNLAADSIRGSLTFLESPLLAFNRSVRSHLGR